MLTGSIAALVYAYVVRFLALALSNVEAGLARITPAMDEAARTLGCSPIAAAARVHAPLLVRALLIGALLVFVDALKELPATLVLRPFDFDTLATRAYNLAKDERLGEAALPSLTIVLVGLLPVMLVSRVLARGPRHRAERLRRPPTSNRRDRRCAGRPPGSCRAAPRSTDRL